MLGLVVHGLHLLLVVLGLAGVAALLLPQIREAQGRGHAFAPPATVAEHEQRVAALRTAVRTGTLTAPPPPAVDSRPWKCTARDGSLWRAVAASGSAAAAFVHGAMFPHHLREGLLLGAFFFLSAVAQAVWAFLLARAATSNLLVAGLVGNLACIGLWAATRTVGLPFGLIPGPEAVGAWDVSCVIWEWSVVLACTVGLHTGVARRRLLLGRLGGVAWAFVAVSCVVLAVLSFTVGHG